MEVALGASIAGARSFCGMKHVGLNVAADPLYTASYTGVNGGMVIAVADDPGMHSSQNEQDSRHHAIASKVPMLEPSDSGECKEYVKLAYEISEQFDAPVIVRMSTRVAHSQSSVELCDRIDGGLKPYEKTPQKYVMMPAFAKGRHVVVEERTEKLTAYAETSPLNRIEMHASKIGVITSGIAYQYAREALGDTVSYLKLGMVNPLPKKLILDFAAKCDKIYVIEELDDIIETHCRKLDIQVVGKELFGYIGELSQSIIAEKMLGEVKEYTTYPEQLPVRPPVMCPGCPHRGVFYALSKLKCIVSGDIGCYTLGNAMPLDMVDTCLCMGADITMAQGLHRIEPDTVNFSFIGDSTFFASGMTGIVNAVYNRTDIILMVLDNSTTAMTGHQPHPGTGMTMMHEISPKVSIEAILRAVGLTSVETVDPLNLEQTIQAVRTAADKPGVKAIICKSPCIAVSKPAKRLQVDENRCVGCKQCIRELGCPAISLKGQKAYIEPDLCFGCTICAQVCKPGAIREEDAQ